MSKDKRAKARPGRKPEVLKIEGDWEGAVAQAMKRGKPPAEPVPKKGKAKKKISGKRK